MQNYGSVYLIVWFYTEDVETKDSEGNVSKYSRISLLLTSSDNDFGLLLLFPYIITVAN
jgi:hypothetical protein